VTDISGCLCRAFGKHADAAASFLKGLQRDLGILTDLLLVCGNEKVRARINGTKKELTSLPLIHVSYMPLTVGLGAGGFHHLLHRNAAFRAWGSLLCSRVAPLPSSAARRVQGPHCCGPAVRVLT
jgi:hypothetical protein